MGPKSHAFASIAVILALTVCQSGCEKGTSTPETAQASVSGKATFGGTPLTVDSSVLFSCVDCDGMAGGKVDALGNFNLKAADPAVGIPVGRYQVTFQPPTVAAPAPVMGSAEYEEMMKAGGATTERPEAPSDIPEEFLTPQTTPLVLELKEGPNEFEFDLKELQKK